MTRNRYFPLLLHLLCRIVEIEIDQYGVNVSRRFRVHLSDLPTDHLNTPDSGSAQLYLPGVADRDRFECADVGFERGAVKEAAEGVEDHRDAVVGEHGESVDVREAAKGVGSKCGPYI